MRILMLAERALADADSSPDRRVFDLAAGLAGRGHAVRLLVCAQPGEPAREEHGSLVVQRIADYPPIIPRWDAVSGALQRGIGLFEHGIAALLHQPVDLIHGFGWRCAQPAAGLRRAFGLPLVATIDQPRRIARRGRRWNRGDELIDASERWLVTAAARVIVRSPAARRTMADAAGISPWRIAVVGSPRASDQAARRAWLAARIEPLYRDASRPSGPRADDAPLLTLAGR